MNVESPSVSMTPTMIHSKDVTNRLRNTLSAIERSKQKGQTALRKEMHTFGLKHRISENVLSRAYDSILEPEVTKLSRGVVLVLKQSLLGAFKYVSLDEYDLFCKIG